MTEFHIGNARPRASPHAFGDKRRPCRMFLMRQDHEMGDCRILASSPSKASDLPVTPSSRLRNSDDNSQTRVKGGDARIELTGPRIALFKAVYITAPLASPPSPMTEAVAELRRSPRKRAMAPAAAASGAHPSVSDTPLPRMMPVASSPAPVQSPLSATLANGRSPAMQIASVNAGVSPLATAQSQVLQFGNGVFDVSISDVPLPSAVRRRAGSSWTTGTQLRRS
ncbi:hypothetical protein NMY22_g19132 [Coprinellus aureogranulatus]|nr:hypothetical protein NMY22_g19132 [Coprinellus aureogranulatus]